MITASVMKGLNGFVVALFEKRLPPQCYRDCGGPVRDWIGVGTNLKKIYSRTTTKSVPLLQPEHGFFQ